MTLFIFPSEPTRKFIFVMGERRKFKKYRGISYISSLNRMDSVIKHLVSPLMLSSKKLSVLIVFP